MAAATITHPSQDCAPEWSLLLCACSPNPTRSAKFCDGQLEDGLWSDLLSLADRHGVTPLLCKALLREPNLSSEHRSGLLALEQRNIYKCLALARELFRVLDALAKFGIPVLPYKGIALAESLYGDIALRQAGDLDMLVRAQDLAAIKIAVQELGYSSRVSFTPEEEQAYLATGYECAFDGPAGPNLLEVQWALQPRFYAIDLNMEGIFRRSVSATVAGRAIQTLSSEDLFIVLSLHAAKHVWGRLVWISDIAQLTTTQKLDWKQIAEQARALGITRILSTTLLLTRLLFQTEIPAAAEIEFPADAAAESIANEVRGDLFAGRTWQVESVAYFRLMMRLRERRADRHRFFWRLLLTPGPGEWNVVKLPASLFPLYCLIRLSRLAARFARI